MLTSILFKRKDRFSTLNKLYSLSTLQILSPFDFGSSLERLKEQLEEHRLSAEQWQQHAQQLEQRKKELEHEYLGTMVAEW